MSNRGRVKSFVKYKNGKILKLLKDKKGYYFVSLLGKAFRIHRLVAHMFIPNPDNKPEIDHINTIRTDNDIKNLRWATHKENLNNYTTKDNMSKSQKGRRCVAIKDEEIIFFEKIRDADKYGFDHGAVIRCLNKKQCKHLGYEFYYYEDYLKLKGEDIIHDINLKD